MAEPLLTVIVPVHNVHQYLDRSLESIVAQTYQNIEIIIVDDCSTDDTGKMADAWAKRDQRITVLHLAENRGISGARNVGLARARGQFVTFADGDDWLEPDICQFYVDKMQQYRLDFVACGYYVNPGNTTWSGKAKDTFVKKRPLLRLVRKMHSPIRGYTWNKCYRLDVIRQYDLKFDEQITLMEDQIFNVAYVLHTSRYLYNITPLYHYFQRPGSSIHQPNFKKAKDVTKAITTIQMSIWRHEWQQAALNLKNNYKNKAPRLSRPLSKDRNKESESKY
ncbi:glycosyltransferase family 2 protein [Agrilactobacillus fermenti]|uniref:glycosyltransferase family 2 protein n=1 Tax=Agrilactobacillus fermenti TaxID=2586909 RepID=UPI003A5BBDA7